MTVTPIDFPDWNPPRDRITMRFGAAFGGTIANGDAPALGFTAQNAENVFTVSAALEPGTGLGVEVACGFALPTIDRRIVNIATPGMRVKLPMVHYGSGGGVRLYNASGGPLLLGWELDSFAGIAAESFLPSSTDVVLDNLAVPALAASVVVDVPQAALYERCTLTVTATHAATVTVQRATIHNPTLTPGGFVMTTVDQQVLAALGVVDVPVGAPGFAVYLTGTTATPGTATVLARLYRPAGF